MAKNFKNLTDGEKKELQDLIAKKKANKLTETEAARLSELNEKCGFKGGKSNSKEGFKPGNDFSWWNKEPELLKDAANFKCNYIAGTQIAGADLPYVIPGIAVILVDSIYGSDASAVDAINVWARDLYLRMFHNYRPASGYSASDLGIALIAAVEAVKVIAKYERIYGVINRYSKLNVNMPELEAAALGLSSTELQYLQGHMSDFRYDLNFLIRKAQRLCVPKDMSVLADAISLFGYEYLDHDSPRSQIIMFDFQKIGVYDDTMISVGGSIQFDTPTNGWFDFNANNMCVALQDVLDPLLGSDSIQRIFADLVVWFGEAAMLQLVQVPEEYITLPVYSESILHKMHNMECVSNIPSDKLTSFAVGGLSTADEGIVLNGLYHVYQANDRIITKGIMIGSGAATPATYNGGKVLSTGTVGSAIQKAHVLDTYRYDATEEYVTEGVILKNCSSLINISSTTYARAIDSAVFYLVRSVTLYQNNPTGSPTTTVVVTTIAGSISQATGNAGVLAILDWAPLIYNLVAGGTIDGVFGDMDNVIPLYYNDINRLQRTIILSGLHTDVKSIRK